MPKLKAYTDKFGLITSREFFEDWEIPFIISELIPHCNIRKVYKTTGKSSVEINLSIKEKKPRPLYYIRPDGIKVSSLSIHPRNYPMTAFYADGTIETILL